MINPTKRDIKLPLEEIMMKKLLLVYNPHSGTGTIPKYLSEIITILTAGGFVVTVHPTSAPLDGQIYISENAADYDIVVSAGGDGMLHELVNAVVTLPSPKPCGYIPAGTVNDYATSLTIPKDITKAAQTIINGEFISVDAGKLNDRYFSYVAAFGMFTDVSYSTDQKAKNIFGAGAYLMNAVRSLDIRHFNETSTRLTIEANGEEITDEFIFGLCGNTYYVGGVQNVVPYGSNMQDGLLDGLVHTHSQEPPGNSEHKPGDYQPQLRLQSHHLHAVGEVQDNLGQGDRVDVGRRGRRQDRLSRGVCSAPRLRDRRAADA